MTKRDEQELVQLLLLFAKETVGTGLSHTALVVAHQFQDYFERKAKES